MPSRVEKWRATRLYKTDRARDFDHERDRNVRAKQIYETIDRQGFQWIVVLVAGIGFFLDGYTLFVSNIVLPMISYVYWENDTTSQRSHYVNIATLTGTMVGQVVFGFFADKYGRKRMYGVELLLLIVATMGMLMSSQGAERSMDVFAWLIWWRIVVGIAVGADYPLSAVITSELAPTKHRATMMASVFFMQPLGQICGNVVSLVVVAITRANAGSNGTKAMDQIWRWVVGIGILPGVVGVFLRFAIPETPRFLLDIEDDPIKAEFDASELFGDRDTSDTELDESPLGESIRQDSVVSQAYDDRNLMSSAHGVIQSKPIVTLNSSWTLSRRDIVQYFWAEKNWITLFGTMTTWMLLDFGFYGIGLSSPKFLAKTWGSLNISRPTPSWKTTEDPNVSIYDMFFRTSVHALIILNIGSFAGGVLMIVLASRINQVSLQKYGFLVLAAIFVALGTMFITIQREGWPAILLVVLGQLFFNFGPNTTTYMIPAQVFPTRYRATCHGLSAGAGKLGSILVQVFSAYYGTGSGTPGDKSTRRYGTVLIVFSGIMIIGAVITHYTVPNVQEKGSGLRRDIGQKTKTLEELAVGRAGLKSDLYRRGRRQTEI